MVNKMFNWLFGKKSKSRLGIDLGGAAIKIVELTKKDERLALTNYALAQAKEEAVFKFGDISDEEVARILSALLKDAKISSRRANISLPISRTFSTVIDLPMMSQEELEAAVPFEAKKYVPVPLDEVVLDWSVIGEMKSQSVGQEGNVDIRPAGGDDAVSSQLQILLVAVPKEIITKITRIAGLANLEILSLEQEAFSLARSLVGNDQNAFLLVDIGRRSSDIVIINEGFIRLSHNLETIDQEMLLMEIDRLVSIFRVRYNKDITQCLLTGGRTNERDFFNLFSRRLKMSVKVGDPFARIVRPPSLESILKNLGPQLAVAAGLAMRE